MENINEALKELKFLLEFDGKFVKVATEHGITFEVYPKEMGHNEPHFHVKIAEFRGSFSLIDFRRLNGNFPKQKERKIKEWALKHYDELKQCWNEHHKWVVL